MTERVILAVDGGPASASALDWVVDRARSTDIELQLTSVVELEHGTPSPVEAEYRRAHAAALMSAAETAEAAVPGVAVTQVLRHGKPAIQLIAASQKADLLVIGTNKTRHLAGLVHGTLPLRIAGRSRCTVVVVPAGWTPVDGPVVTGWEDDGTGDVTLAFAASEAERRSADLVVVHSWTLPPAIGMGGFGIPIILDDIPETHRHALAGVVDDLRRSFPGVTVEERLETSSASHAIVDAAHGASIVVVGSHGRGALGGLIIGSVSHDVLMNMPAPVAVVPYPEKPITVLPEITDEYLI